MDDAFLMAPAHNLPVQPTSFIGRERELAEVQRLLSISRLVTLTGAGGAGKTRLALRTAAEAQAQFEGGVWLVELGSLIDSALVPAAVAAALGLREDTRTGVVDLLATSLRSSEFLLVLDNCEHVLDACARLADAVLKACPGGRVLATSLEPLGIAGETTWRVPSLAMPWPWGDVSPQHVSTFEAVRLFVARARAALPDFALSESNARAVAELCYRLDGIPLAIELAATRVRMLTPLQMVERLDDRFRLLTGGSRLAPQRHQTLRALVDWSHELLSLPERVLFRRLGVFAGGFTLEAAESVGAGGPIERKDVLGLLGQLVDRSLVLAEHGEEPRYRLQETLRAYARERLQVAEEEEPAGERHYRWFRQLAEHAEPQLWDAQAVVWLERLEIEHDNFRVALRWSLDQQDGDLALRLSGTLVRFWMLHGHLSEGQRWLEEALAKGTEASPEARTAALSAAGNLARDRGDYARAATLHETCLSLRREAGDPWNVAVTLNNLGVIAQLRGDSRLAEAHCQEALAVLREIGHTEGTAVSLLSLAVVIRKQGDLDRAVALNQESLALFEAMGDQRGVAAALNNLGGLANDRGDLTGARSCYERSLAILRELGDSRDVAASLMNLAMVTLDGGEYRRAQELASQSLVELRALGDRRGLVACLEVLARVAWAAGLPSLSAELLGAGEALGEAIGSPVPSTNEVDYASCRVQLRAALGARSFEKAWATGRALTLESVLERALAAGGSGSRAVDRPESGVGGPLTPREREVAVLVASGCSNRQIAERLVIAPGTAALHVEHIRGKLGFSSRAQVAAWAVEQGLATPSNGTG